jgi:hypothetical protein
MTQLRPIGRGSPDGCPHSLDCRLLRCPGSFFNPAPQIYYIYYSTILLKYKLMYLSRELVSIYTINFIIVYI